MKATVIDQVQRDLRRVPDPRRLRAKYKRFARDYPDIFDMVAVRPLAPEETPLMKAILQVELDKDDMTPEQYITAKEAAHTCLKNLYKMPKATELTPEAKVLLAMHQDHKAGMGHDALAAKYPDFARDHPEFLRKIPMSRNEFTLFNQICSLAKTNVSQEVGRDTVVMEASRLFAPEIIGEVRRPPDGDIDLDAHSNNHE